MKKQITEIKNVKLNNEEITKFYTLLTAKKYSESKTEKMINMNDIVNTSIEKIIKNGIPQKLKNILFSSNPENKNHVKAYIFKVFNDCLKDENRKSGRYSETFESLENEHLQIEDKKQVKSLHRLCDLHRYIIKRLDKRVLIDLDLRVIDYRLLKQIYSFYFIKNYKMSKISKILGIKILKIKIYKNHLINYIQILNLTHKFDFSFLIDDAQTINYQQPILKMAANSKFIDRLLKNNEITGQTKDQEKIKVLFEKIHKVHERKHSQSCTSEQNIKDSITFNPAHLQDRFNLHWSYEISKKYKAHEKNGKVTQIKINKYFAELKNAQVTKELVFDKQNFDKTMLKSVYNTYLKYDIAI
jgi:hypothetical protein